MKDFLKVFALCAVPAYLFGAFVEWSVDPAEWREEIRRACAIGCAAAVALHALAKRFE